MLWIGIILMPTRIPVSIMKPTQIRILPQVLNMSENVGKIILSLIHSSASMQLFYLSRQRYYRSLNYNYFGLGYWYFLEKSIVRLYFWLKWIGSKSGYGLAGPGKWSGSGKPADPTLYGFTALLPTLRTRSHVYGKKNSGPGNVQNVYKNREGIWSVVKRSKNTENMLPELITAIEIQ